MTKTDSVAIDGKSFKNFGKTPASMTAHRGHLVCERDVEKSSKVNISHTLFHLSFSVDDILNGN